MERKVFQVSETLGCQRGFVIEDLLTALGGSRGQPFTATVRNKFVRVTPPPQLPTSLEGSVIGPFCRPDLTVGTLVAELRTRCSGSDWTPGWPGPSGGGSM